MSLKLLMRKSVSPTSVFALLFTGSMLAAAFNIQTAKANPLTIEVSPTSAAVGDTITISGLDATPLGEVKIYFVGMIFIATTTANETGGYSISVTVPPVPTDTYPIMALDVASGDTQSTTFTVEPRILLTPSQGEWNTEVSVVGDGFSYDSNVTIMFDWIDVTPSTVPHTDFLGSFQANFWVPSIPNGTYTVTATDELGYSATTEFRVIPTLATGLRPSGAPSSLAFVSGYGFASDVNATLMFDSVDVTPYPYFTTSWDGSFSVLFFVPQVPDGIYTITATDDEGNSASLTFVVPSPLLTLSPNRTFESSVVTAMGWGFQPSAPVLLYLEDMTMTSMVDLLLMSPNLMTDVYGYFEYQFVVPITKPGVYSVSAYGISGPWSAEAEKLASAPLTVVEGQPLDLEVNVGSTHFRGELAEFYVKTAFDGNLVNAKIDKAKLYYSNGSANLDLASDVQAVDTGLFRIPYSIPGDATKGTYTLVVEAHYYADATEAYGTGSGNFLVSPALTTQNALLIELEDNIGSIVISDLGIIKVNLTAINAKLVSVEEGEATIQSDIGTLKTNTDTINAKVTSIDGNVATISSDLGTVKSQVTTTGFQVETAALIFSLIAAAGSMLSVLLIRRIKPSGSLTPPSSTPTTAKPADPSEPSPVTEQSEPAEPVEQSSGQHQQSQHNQHQTEASSDSDSPK